METASKPSSPETNAPLTLQKLEIETAREVLDAKAKNLKLKALLTMKRTRE